MPFLLLLEGSWRVIHRDGYDTPYIGSDDRL